MSEKATGAAATAGAQPSALRHVVLVARREAKMLRRSRASTAAAGVIFGVAWLPPLLLALRSGGLGLAPFDEVSSLALALGGVVLPLLGLLAGANALAAEMEDRSLIPVLTASVSRLSCYLGKLAGLTLALTVVYLAAFGSAGIAIAATRGATGAADYIVVAAAGLGLMIACLGAGVALAAAGAGRVRAYALALAGWMLLVIVVDALLLTAVIVSAPPPPAEVGQHGHDELAASMEMRRAGGEATEDDSRADGGPYAWLMLLDPVDLYRLTALQSGPGLRAQWLVGGPSAESVIPRAGLLLGWTLWLSFPALLGLRRFRRAALV